MTIRETLPDAARHDLRILATDLHSEVLSKGRNGVYGQDRVKGLWPARLKRFFQERRAGDTAHHVVTDELRQLITFNQLNLMSELPMKGPFDAIFCRNVVIYFDKDTQRDLFRRYARRQRPGDILFLGHSESMFKVCADYTLVGRTIYRRN